MNGAVRALTVLPNGDLVAGGLFTTAGGVAANRIARWSGSTWSALSGGMNNQVFALTVLPNGDLVAGGWFSTVGGITASRIARWNGSTWSALGSGMNGPVQALTVLPNGDLVAGGWFSTAGGAAADGIARWNGSTWSALGSGFGTNASVTALTVMPNGDLVAGGVFFGAGGVAHIARWNGSAWSAIGSGIDGTNRVVFALTALPNGDLVAGGYFTTAGGLAANNIARWNGSTWSALGSGIGSGIGNGEVDALIALPNGDLVAGGYFTTAGGVAANNIARWNGSTWSAIGSGMNSAVGALNVLPNGDLVAGGYFTTAGGSVSAYHARLTTTCPATATPIPTACIGPSGPITLSANTLPWTGGTFRSTATGLGASAIAAALVGFGSPATPLSLLSPNGIPGCDLLASPDSALILVPTAGAASWLFGIPNSSVWAGLPLFHQFLQLEVAPTMTLSSSNALALTLGTF